MLKSLLFVKLVVVKEKYCVGKNLTVSFTFHQIRIEHNVNSYLRVALSRVLLFVVGFLNENETSAVQHHVYWILNFGFQILLKTGSGETHAWFTSPLLMSSYKYERNSLTDFAVDLLAIPYPEN